MSDLPFVPGTLVVMGVRTALHDPVAWDHVTCFLSCGGLVVLLSHVRSNASAGSAVYLVLAEGTVGQAVIDTVYDRIAVEPHTDVNRRATARASIGVQGPWPVG